MDVKIIDIYEEKGQLRVEVEHEYGKDNIGLSLEAKYLGNDGQPRWKKEITDLLSRKYGNRNKDKSLPKKQVFESEVGKTIKI